VQGGDVEQDLLQLGMNARSVHVFNDAADKPLELDDVGGVQSLLQGVDALPVDLSAQGAVLHVHDLKVRDGATAIVKNLQHFLNAEVAQAQGDAPGRMDSENPAGELLGRKPQQGGRIRLV